MKANVNKYPTKLTEKESYRFWAKVDKNGPWSLRKNYPGQCWIWTAYIRKDGYADFWLHGGMVASHRLSYTLRNGGINEHLVLDHLCRNRACVNPDHLEVVTNKENVSRGLMTARQVSKIHCSRGHILDQPNLVKSALVKNMRSCLACSRTTTKYTNSKVRKGVLIDPNLFQQISDEYYNQIMRLI